MSVPGPLPWPMPHDSVPLGLPVGAVTAFAGEIATPGAAPAMGVTDIESWGWMVCDGRQLSARFFPELFSVLGFRYVQTGESDELPSGSGAEDIKFRIPDYRGWFLRGVDTGAGVDPDAGGRALANGTSSDAVGSTQQYALQNHAHKYNTTVAATASPSEDSAGAPSPQQASTTGVEPFEDKGDLLVSDSETRPVNMYVYFIIKYTGGLYQVGAPTVGPVPGDGWML